ncbi:hypothetical protein BO85DRAFT_251459 [Aspergillus piperis CBS 112811]|uniref:Uncharacterized protein n=1 Tax=Aspergillus piperis CBS 112811 TaxID=1448313 RepID=A0A8G1R5B4_9EURO|nr:hypothetical protein BO85DRAFT_251459 [Aspergillus piperis CBS 112811]RAH59848.1 hypothetical protein BO85DRAFT_251459 [Aspergillus piperis CBS 112811]
MIPIGASSDKYFFLTPFHCFLCYPGLPPPRSLLSCLLPLSQDPCHAGYPVRRIRPSPSVHYSFLLWLIYLYIITRKWDISAFYLPCLD